MNYAKDINRLKKASEELGVLRTAICNVLSGIARTAGGYRWRKVGVS